MSAQHVANIALALSRLPHVCRVAAPSAATLDAMQQQAQQHVLHYNGQALSNFIRYFASRVRRAGFCLEPLPSHLADKAAHASCQAGHFPAETRQLAVQGQPPKPSVLAAVCNHAVHLMQTVALPIMSVSYLVSLLQIP